MTITTHHCFAEAEQAPGGSHSSSHIASLAIEQIAGIQASRSRFPIRQSVVSFTMSGPPYKTILSGGSRDSKVTAIVKGVV